MGNVNAREDGSGSPSAAEEDAGAGGTLPEAQGHVAPGGPSDLMGQSPPHSPRATHSPLMFTPQVRFFFYCIYLFLFFFSPFLVGEFNDVSD